MTTRTPHGFTENQLDYIFKTLDSIWLAGFTTGPPLHNIYEAHDGTVDFIKARQDGFGGYRKLL